ncbi:hypothetical protein SAMN04488051_1179, partial [Alkalimonas amylolytica]
MDPVRFRNKASGIGRLTLYPTRHVILINQNQQLNSGSLFAVVHASYSLQSQKTPMDVLKPKATKRWKKPGLALALVAVASLAGVLLATPQHAHKIDRSRVLLAEVQRGDLQVSVDAYGVLRSDRQTLLTALTPATVQQVLLRPGALVTQDSIILQLSNPELIQDVEAAA